MAKKQTKKAQLATANKLKFLTTLESALNLANNSDTLFLEKDILKKLNDVGCLIFQELGSMHLETVYTLKNLELENK